MTLPRFSVGLAAMAAGWILARVVVHYSHLGPDVDPRQAWFSMSGGLKAAVFASALLFLAGVGILLLALIDRITRKRN